MQEDYKEIWPSELGNLGVPVWGDKVIISPDSKAFMTVRAMPGDKKVLLGSFPKAPASGRSMKTLLANVTRLRLSLTARCSAGPLSLDAAEEIAVEVKTALEHYRSILDYVAHDIYGLCAQPPNSSKTRKLYFPIAGANETNADFHRRFQKEYPQLRNNVPALFKRIIEIQRFSGEQWLHNLASLVNPMKHLQLAEWEEIECKSLIIHLGGVGIRIGELGLQSVSIPKNQELHFVSPKGVEQAIRGPQELDLNTTTLTDADPDIKLDPFTWKTTAIKGTGRSVAGLLAEIDGGVRTVCCDVTRALHP